MDPTEEVERLGQALQRLIESHDTTARALSRRLGYHHGHLTLVFHGHRPMRVRLVFELLDKLRAAPIRFFKACYPLGGPAHIELRKDAKPSIDLPGAMPLTEAAQRRADRLGLRLTPAGAAEKLGRILRREIRASGKTQREISLDLGLGAGALGQALRGNSELTFLHVFGVLATIGRSPGRLFAELFAPEPGDPMARFELALELDHQEEQFRATAEGALARRKGGNTPKPRPAKRKAPRTRSGRKSS